MLEMLLPKEEPELKQRPQVGNLSVGRNGVTLDFIGEPRKTYDLQYSDRLNSPVWATVQSDLSGEIYFEDDDSVRLSRRGGFYRFVEHLGKGDFDENGAFGDRDIDILTTAIRNAESALMYDLNDDGIVDMSDRKFLVEHQSKLGTSIGDLNLNGEVDFMDYFKFSQELGNQNSVWVTGDFDGDGMTDLTDFLLLSDKFGTKKRLDSNPISHEAPWQNIGQPEDVNGDGSVDAADVVVLIK